MSSASSHRVERGLVSETMGPIDLISVEFNNCAPMLSMEIFTVSNIFGLRRVSWDNSSSNPSEDRLNGLS